MYLISDEELANLDIENNDNLGISPIQKIDSSKLGGIFFTKSITSFKIGTMYKLRDYQIKAVDNTVAHFKKSTDPAVIVLPTGAGKSLVISKLAQLAKGRVLVLAHVKELVEQNHEKYESYGLQAGIYSAGLKRKDSSEQVIFSSVQSFVRGQKEIFENFSLLIIDECHRVSLENDTQYQFVIENLKKNNPAICILGLTATPYRLSTGWIYEYHYSGFLKTSEKRFFKKCIFELSLKYMIDHGFLTPPIQIDSPVACYNFKSLMERTEGRRISQADLEESLKDQKRITPSIIKNVLDLSADRLGVMIFTSTVKHAIEILKYMPKDKTRIVIGDTKTSERDEIIKDFKDQKVKYLINVSVLTTGFDAPHVDVIAILRPTQSISLYQQIVGRGLRLFPKKKDCLILDYTGLNYDIFSPIINDKKPTTDSVIVEVPCPKCEKINHFWGIKDEEGEVIEHFGRKCKAYNEESDGQLIECGFLFRFKICPTCQIENEISARTCKTCESELVDHDKVLKEAMSLKDAHVMKPDTMSFEKELDKNKNERLKITYYDFDANELVERYYLNGHSDLTAFHLTFTRFHLKMAGNGTKFNSIEEVINKKNLLKIPAFVIARKEHKYWKVREKIFF